MIHVKPLELCLAHGMKVSYNDKQLTSWWLLTLWHWLSIVSSSTKGIMYSPNPPPSTLTYLNAIEVRNTSSEKAEWLKCDILEVFFLRVLCDSNSFLRIGFWHLVLYILGEARRNIWALPTSQHKWHHQDSYPSMPTSGRYEGYIHLCLLSLVVSDKDHNLAILNHQRLVDSKSSSTADWLNNSLWW